MKHQTRFISFVNQATSDEYMRFLLEAEEYLARNPDPNWTPERLWEKHKGIGEFAPRLDWRKTFAQLQNTPAGARER